MIWLAQGTGISNFVCQLGNALGLSLFGATADVHFGFHVSEVGANFVVKGDHCRCKIDR